MRKLFVAVLSLLVMTCTAVCFAAETYQVIYDAENFTENMRDNDAVSDTFSTPYGTLKFQMRKLWQTGSDKRMHLIVWLNDTRISEQYYPEVTNGYTFRVIKNTSNSELYYVVQSIERAYMYGYSPDAQKIVTYIDSQNYAHEPGTFPYIVVLKNGNLVLAFENAYIPHPRSSRYQFTWDASKKWFGYSDIGKDWPSIIRDKQ
ncbi:hypothetical protein D081_1156 [Anaerovibrio sp. JC8]|uniref:hypothetical protein n=1 Tax=Anaerovibrio sp. JC8 TaxID=1240085 RepID=UPI000A0E9E54|nr:hypothetical protein [Anaerovibrio sp. JC8]ORU00062.1 hypothetical protein D081_1156 [Anaerovibrio sp. JC8]